jgi:hypothetical protein
MGDRAVDLLVETNAFQHLRALGIDESGFGSTGARRLIGARSLHQLERLATRDYLQGDGLVTLLRSGGLTALRALSLGGRHHLDEVAPLIPTTVVELRIEEVDDDGIAALAASPVAAKLERLEVRTRGIPEALQRFALFPRLRSLSIFAVGVGSTQIEILASQTLPALRELTLLVNATEDAVRLVADSLGPQLELLDLRNNRHALRHVNTLKAKVAGELLVGADMNVGPGLLRVSPTIQAPWWDHVPL